MYGGLGEDRLEVVLHSVLRQEHQPSKLMGVDPLDQMVEKLGLPGRQAVGDGEQRGPLRWGTVLQGDGDVALAGWLGVLHSGCPQG